MSLRTSCVAQPKASEIANSVGYASEAAFSRAYKKLFGKSPKHHRSR